jgi:hypothetical protein
MNSAEYRAKFKEFLGDEDRYKKFVATVNRGREGRLLFWQERAVERFCSSNVIPVSSYEDLRELFAVCELHGNKLENGTVKVFKGHVDYSQEYNKACQELFPNSYMSDINGPQEMWGKYLEIRYCQACRDAEHQWKS